MLSKEQKHILFEEGTEPPGTSPLNYEKREGDYLCAGCSTKLFESKLKYENFIAANGIEITGIEYLTDKNGTIYTYDVNTNTNYNSQAEKNSEIKGMRSIAHFLKEELLLLSILKLSLKLLFFYKN